MGYVLLVIICILGIYVFGYFWATKEERKINKENKENKE